MIYLVEDRDYLKIGFTTNIKQRESNYKTENCYAKFVDWKPGTKQDETKLHELCEKWHYSREWFHNVPEVWKIWNDYESQILQEFRLTREKMNTIFNKIKKDRVESIPNTMWTSVVKSNTYNYKNTITKIVSESVNQPYYQELLKLYNDWCAFVILYECVNSNYYCNYEYDFGNIKFISTVHKESNDEYDKINQKLSFIFK